MSILVVICMILYVYQSLSVGIAVIGWMWGPIVHHCLIDGIAGFVRKDAGGQAGHNFRAALLMCCLQHIIVYQQIVPLPKQRDHFIMCVYFQEN